MCFRVVFVWWGGLVCDRAVCGVVGWCTVWLGGVLCVILVNCVVGWCTVY